MGYWYTPTNYTFKELFEIKKGDKGDRVAAVQLNLRKIAVDGNFGDETERRVKEWQANHDILVAGKPPGVVGPKTQESIVRHRTKGAEVYKVPAGLLASVAKHESGYALAAYSSHPSDWGYDLGPYQNSIGPMGDLATQGVFESSYDAEVMARRTASQARSYHDRFMTGAAMETPSFYASKLIPKGLMEYNKDIWAWQLAVFSWNWPAAAVNLSNVGHCYQDFSRDDDSEQWIIDASGGRYQTPREWALAYLDSATKGIRWAF